MAALLLDSDRDSFWYKAASAAVRAEQPRHWGRDFTSVEKATSIFKRMVRRADTVDTGANSDWGERRRLMDFWMTTYWTVGDTRQVPGLANGFCKLITAVGRIRDDRPIKPYASTKPNVHDRRADIEPVTYLWFAGPFQYRTKSYCELRFPRLQSRVWLQELSELNGMVCLVSLSLPIYRIVKAWLILGHFQSHTYRAPEYDVEDGFISSPSEVFSMGCMFLEHITLFLTGEEGVSQFIERRKLEDPKYQGLQTDVFFEASQDLQTAKVKKGVTDWIEHLRQQPDCCEYIWHLLGLIETRMLEPNPAKRVTQTELLAELQALQRRAELSEDFYMKHWTER
jgi:hypothetical protein